MAERNDESQALTRQQSALPTPLFTGQQMSKALELYKDLQRSLDASMPDQLINLQGKAFRKKGYWRAVTVAFGLTIECVKEERTIVGVFDDGRDNFAYNVTYRASTADGRSAEGDGSCSAAEKAGKFKCPHPEHRGSKRSLHFPHETCPDYDPSYAWRSLPLNATEHNVRSHAHSRAFNRAVSNLVGFGEVSAEEVDQTALHTEDAPIDTTATRVENGPTRPQAAPAPAQGRGDEPPHPADLGESELPPPRQPDARQAAGRPAPARAPQQAARPASRPAGGAVISEAQDRRLFALAMQAGWDANDMRSAIAAVWGYKRTDEIEKRQYNQIVTWIQRGPDAAAADVNRAAAR